MTPTAAVGNRSSNHFKSLGVASGSGDTSSRSTPPINPSPTPRRRRHLLAAFRHSRLAGCSSQQTKATHFQSAVQSPRCSRLAGRFFLIWSIGPRAVGLGGCVYLSRVCTSKVTKLCDLSNSEDTVTLISWAQRGTHLSVGTNKGEVQLRDTIKCEKVRTMGGHMARVVTLAWTGPIFALVRLSLLLLPTGVDGLESESDIVGSWDASSKTLLRK